MVKMAIRVTSAQIVGRRFCFPLGERRPHGNVWGNCGKSFPQDRNKVTVSNL